MSPRIAALVTMVAEVYGITPESIRSRHGKVVQQEARQVVMWLAVEAWGLQTCVIARALDRDKRSVQRGNYRIAALRWADANFRQQTDRMLAQVKAASLLVPASPNEVERKNSRRESVSTENGSVHSEA